MTSTVVSLFQDDYDSSCLVLKSFEDYTYLVKLLTEQCYVPVFNSVVNYFGSSVYFVIHVRN